MRAAGWMLLCALPGCGHTHLAHNAPGHVDVMTPPAALDRRELEQPKDPGERMVVLAAGPFGGGGVAFGGDEDEARGGWAVGPELSVGYGSRERSHHEDDFVVMPDRSLGATLGWTAVTGEGQGVGPIYGELYYHELITWLGGGWAWDPDDHVHGPQLTLTTMVLYLRATHLFDGSTQIHGGLMMKLPVHGWVWSQ